MGIEQEIYGAPRAPPAEAARSRVIEASAVLRRTNFAYANRRTINCLAEASRLSPGLSQKGRRRHLLWDVRTTAAGAGDTPTPLGVLFLQQDPVRSTPWPENQGHPRRARESRAWCAHLTNTMRAISRSPSDWDSLSVTTWSWCSPRLTDYRCRTTSNASSTRGSYHWARESALDSEKPPVCLAAVGGSSMNSRYGASTDIRTSWSRSTPMKIPDAGLGGTPPGDVSRHQCGDRV